MRIKRVETIDLDKKEKVYDVVDVYPYNNFEIVTETGRRVISHNSILERMGSRFMVDGKIAGCLFVVSSKKSEHDFIEQYVQKKKNDPRMFIADAPLWEVKPSGTYSGKTFAVAVGGANMASRIIPDDELEFSVKLDSGEIRTYRYGDTIELANGSIIKAQDIKKGDMIV